MSEVFDCTTPEGLAAGIEAAARAVQSGQVVVLPTDTVYGIGCDAFDASAVTAVLAAKGRGRDMPPPVLVPNARTVDGLAQFDFQRSPGALRMNLPRSPARHFFVTLAQQLLRSPIGVGKTKLRIQADISIWNDIQNECSIVLAHVPRGRAMSGFHNWRMTDCTACADTLQIQG